MSQKTIVISGINITDSGILSIMTDCLVALEKYHHNNDIKIIALVHSKSLFKIANIKFIEFPKSKKSWFLRLYYEYFYFKKLSKKLQPDIWFSLHDISPRVIANKKFVYCHNPAPFYNIKKRDWLFGFKICLFTLLYRYTYQFNIKSNTAVFVQQKWIKIKFENWFNIKNCKVAYPETKTNQEIEKINLEPNKFHFFYPSFPRMFKNFEYLFDAILLLPNDLKNKVQLHVTISGNENLYSKTLFQKYSEHPQFKFIGAINRTKVAGYYDAMDALIFPSKLETWGLPITETKEFDKSIFVSDLPYAKETIGNYNKTVFFDLKNPQDLTSKLVAFMNNKLEYSKIETASYKPDFTGWESIFNDIFND